MEIIIGKSYYNQSFIYLYHFVAWNLGYWMILVWSVYNNMLLWRQSVTQWSFCVRVECETGFKLKCQSVFPWITLVPEFFLAPPANTISGTSLILPNQLDHTPDPPDHSPEPMVRPEANRQLTRLAQIRCYIAIYDILQLALTGNYLYCLVLLIHLKSSLSPQDSLLCWFFTISCVLFI